MSSVEPGKIRIQAIINNDEKATVRIATFSAYVNGAAYPKWHISELERRKKLEVRISTVATLYTINEDVLEVARLAK